MRAAGFLVVLGLAAAAPVSAQPFFGGGSSSVSAADSARDAELDARTAEIASRFRCLVCRGQSVQESSSQLAREMQALIRLKLEEGESEEEIEAFFIASYGDFILLKPRAQGLGLLVYVVPAAAFILAFVTIAVRLRSRRESVTVAAGVGGSPSAAAPDGVGTDLSESDQAWIDSAIREEA